MTTETMTSAEDRYSDAMYSFENTERDDGHVRAGADVIRNLYAAASDYVSELQERLQERDDVYAEALGVLGDIHKEIIGERSEHWDDVRYLTDDVIGVMAERDEARESLAGVERYHFDAHSGPFHMCWEGVCAYVNGRESIEAMWERVS